MPECSLPGTRSPVKYNRTTKIYAGEKIDSRPAPLRIFVERPIGDALVGHEESYRMSEVGNLSLHCTDACVLMTSSRVSNRLVLMHLLCFLVSPDPQFEEEFGGRSYDSQAPKHARFTHDILYTMHSLKL